MEAKLATLTTLESKIPNDKRMLERKRQLEMTRDVEELIRLREQKRVDPKFDVRKEELVKVFGEDNRPFVNGLMLCDEMTCSDCLCCQVKFYKDKGLSNEEITELLL